MSAQYHERTLELEVWPGMRVWLYWEGVQFAATAVRPISKKSWRFEDGDGRRHDRYISRTFVVPMSPLEQLAHA